MKYSKEEIEKLISLVKENKSWDEIGIELNRTGEQCREKYRRLRKSNQSLPVKGEPDSNLSAQEQIEKDKRVISLSRNKSDVDKKYKLMLDENDKLQRELEIALQTTQFNPKDIEYKAQTNDSEAVAVMVASDFHLEELVKSEKVNGLNEFNLRVAEQRAKEFFQNGVRLLKKEQQDVKIKTLILALLGDFISSNIHEELLENCQLRPAEAIIFAEELIVGGIEYILKHTEVNLIIPCCVGNHTRITRKVHISTEQGNSLETIMYSHIARYFKDNKRVKCIIAKGYHQYVTIFDNYTIRFHHGHAMSYGGGVGSIYIPVRKAIAQWQKIKPANLDVFGHFHNYKIDGDLFVLNGSLIGFNAFALAIKADYEKPRQAFFLIDKKRGKTVHCPIMFSV
jgi:hypothetical protein